MDCKTKTYSLKGEKGEQMQGLLGDRFLKRFAGNLKHRREQLALLLKDQTPQAKAELAAELDSQFSEEDIVKKAADSHDVPNAVEQDEEDEI
ncbi:MAG TPA: hypothetical protein VF823_02415 [Anaerolineales bacterium]